MKTVEYLNSCLDSGGSLMEALGMLNATFGIKYSIFDEYGLVVLNYDQIESPKAHEITVECRSLVLVLPYEDYEIPEYINKDEQPEYLNNFQVVSRSFDRFFNYGENGCNPDVMELTFFDKLDGSLVGVFYHNGEWLYRTRSMIMPTSFVSEIDNVTWKDFIEFAVGWEQNFSGNAGNYMRKDITFILEVVSPYNRIVTNYEKMESYLLAIRTITGEYFTRPAIKGAASDLDFKLPEFYHFNNWTSVAEAQKNRRNLEEGVVGYNAQGVPVCKVKNPAYVAAHHLRGEGVLTPRRVVDLMNINEHEEYLAVFPQDTEKFMPWILARANILWDIEATYESIKGAATQKEFALEAVKHPYQGILFSMRKGLTTFEAWSKVSTDSQIELLKTQMKEI